MPRLEADGFPFHGYGVSLVEGDEVVALVCADVDVVQLRAMRPMVWARQASDLVVPLLARAMRVAGNVEGARSVAAGAPPPAPFGTY